MEISAVRDDGDFQGKYLTRVTLAGGCARASPLKGAQQQPSEGGWPTFAFTVRWDKFSSKCWGTPGDGTTGALGATQAASGIFPLLASLLRDALVQLSRGRQWRLPSVGLMGNAGLTQDNPSSPSPLAPILPGSLR